MNTIAVCTYRRSEMLQIFLERLSLCPELPEYRLHFFLDKGYNPENLEVVKEFHRDNPKQELVVTIRPQKIGLMPATYNIMDSYRIAAEESSEYVIPCEEDIIPSRDFLRFNHKVYEKFLKPFPRIFCVAHKRRPETEKKGLVDVLIGDTQCTSPTCVTTESVFRYMIPAMKLPAYFTDPVYCHAMFYPNSRIPPNIVADHDGKIERIIEYNQLFALKPDQARTAHIGFDGGDYGSGRGIALKGSLRERVEYLRSILMNGPALRSHAIHFVEGIVTTNLDGYDWEDLYLDTNRDVAIASSWWYDEGNHFKKYMDSAHGTGRGILCSERHSTTHI